MKRLQETVGIMVEQFSGGGHSELGFGGNWATLGGTEEIHLTVVSGITLGELRKPYRVL